MKKIFGLSIAVIMGISSLFAIGNSFLKEYHQPRSIIVAFTKESIGNPQGIIETSRSNDVIETKMHSINQLAHKYRFVKLEQIHDDVKNLEWNDNNIYVQNIYRITLKDNDDVEEALASLKKDKNILFAEYESINKLLYTPNDPDFSMQWHHKAISSNQAWDYVKGSKEVVVAITDTGVKWNHPDLANNIWINEAELSGITIDWENGQILGGNGRDDDGNGRIDDVIGWDFVDKDNNPYQNYEGNQHGTHVAGCAGAVGDNEKGITGVAMNVSLMVCKGAPADAPSDGVQYAYEQIVYAAQSGADIINCSWIGQGQASYSSTIINQATALGSLIIAGAGNGDVEHIAGWEWYPSDHDKVISVAAVGPSDIKANFSDYGEKIDISSPGVNIRSTILNDAYGSSQGTSMASPIVAGAAALIKTLFPSITPMALKDRLLLTSDYIEDLNDEKYIGKLGMGRLNVFKATMYDLIPNITLFGYNIEEEHGDGDGIPNPGEEISLNISLENEIDWMTAKNVTATLTTDYNDVEILAGEVSFPNIDGGSVAFNSNFPFIFKLAENSSNYKIPFTITVEANPNERFPYIKTFDIEVELSLQQPGWPLSLSGTSTSSALITDIDMDGTPDIVFGDSKGNLHALHADKTYLAGFPVYLESNINSAVAVADLTKDGKKEIVVNTQNGKIFCIDYKGEILFQYEAGGQFRSNPVIADLDNDGSLEIIALSFGTPKLTILKANGKDYPGFPVDSSGTVMSSSCVADLDGDGYKEVIFVTGAGYLHAISSKTGSSVPGFPIPLGSASWGGPTIADFDNDGKPDIVVANISGGVYAYNNEGNIIYEKSIGKAIRSGVLAFDLNNDGNVEVVFTDMEGGVHVTDSNANYLEGFPINTGFPIESTPVLADLSNNGEQDILYGDNGGFLHAINLQGKAIDSFPINLESPLVTSAAIGYAKENSQPSILIPNQNGFNFIDFKRNIGEVTWGVFRGNERRAGNYDDKTSIENNIVKPNNQTQLIGNYPNPFNPETKIVFFLQNEEKATLKIYNVKGQLVRSLINSVLSPGEKSVMWDGKDDNNIAVGSGVYFYTLETASYQKTNRMILLK